MTILLHTHKDATLAFSLSLCGAPGHIPKPKLTYLQPGCQEGSDLYKTGKVRMLAVKCLARNITVGYGKFTVSQQLVF